MQGVEHLLDGSHVRGALVQFPGHPRFKPLAKRDDRNCGVWLLGGLLRPSLLRCQRGALGVVREDLGQDDRGLLLGAFPFGGPRNRNCGVLDPLALLKVCPL